MGKRKNKTLKSRKSVQRADAATNIAETAEAVALPAIDLSKLKIAIVCDWLTGTGGAERVVLELHRLFPDAPIYTSQYDKNPDIWYGDKWFAEADVRTGSLQRLPKKLKKFLPVLRARYFSNLDLSEYDLVIVSSGAEAKAVKVGRHTKVVWYCHAPTHYYWSRYQEYMKNPGMGILNPLARLGLWSLVRPLRLWDFKAAQKPHLIIANSTHIQAEIKKYYYRKSVVVFPPVDTERFGKLVAVEGETGRDRFGFVAVGRQTPYKRIDLAVSACSRLNLPLTVIGNGPEHNKLTAMAGPSVRFLTRVNDFDMAHHLHLAQALLFTTNVEDFGVTAVEAMSAGTPVIAYKAGGPLDYVKPGKTGEFFDDLTTDSLVGTLKKFDTSRYDSDYITGYAQKYSIENFGKNLTSAISDFLGSSK